MDNNTLKSASTGLCWQSIDRVYHSALANNYCTFTMC